MDPDSRNLQAGPAPAGDKGAQPDAEVSPAAVSEELFAPPVRMCSVFLEKADLDVAAPSGEAPAHACAVDSRKEASGPSGAPQPQREQDKRVDNGSALRNQQPAEEDNSMRGEPMADAAELQCDLRVEERPTEELAEGEGAKEARKPDESAQPKQPAILTAEELESIESGLSKELSSLRQQIGERQRTMAQEPVREPSTATEKKAPSSLALAFFQNADTVAPESALFQLVSQTTEVLSAVEQTYPQQTESLNALYKMMRGVAVAQPAMRNDADSAAAAARNARRAAVPQFTTTHKQQLASRQMDLYNARKQRAEQHAKMPAPDNAKALGVNAEQPRNAMRSCGDTPASADGALTFFDLHDDFMLSGLALPQQITQKMTHEEATQLGKKRLFWHQKMKEHAARVLRTLDGVE